MTHADRARELLADNEVRSAEAHRLRVMTALVHAVLAVEEALTDAAQPAPADEDQAPVGLA
jgi:hypothetical protein